MARITEFLSKKPVFLIVLLLIFLVFDPGPRRIGETIEVANNAFGFLGALKYFFLYLFSTGSVLTVFFSDSRFIRFFSLLFFWFTATVFISYWGVNGIGFDFVEALTFLFHPGDTFAIGAIYTFLPIILPTIFFTASITIIFSKIIASSKAKFKISVAITTIISAVLIYKTISFSQGRITAFPFFFKVPIITMYVHATRLYFGPRELPNIKPKQLPIAKHIIYIVDESVRGDFLSINGCSYNPTPFLKTLEQEIVNFGISCSATNRSADSNLILISGLRADAIPDRENKSLKKSNIFLYAKQAGFSTVFLTTQYVVNPVKKTQTHYSHFFNYFTPFDFENIDRQIFPRSDNPELPIFKVDHVIIDYIDEITKSATPTFTMINKMGAHFPYEIRYPPERKLFSPTLSQISINTFFEPKIGIVNTALDRQKAINSYLNVISWSVDVFFELLVKRLKGREVLVVYTSDHGQNLLDDGTAITHCQSFNPHHSQANVPLFLLGLNSDIQEFLKRAFRNISIVKNRMSHFQIFPTILIFMGYDSEEVRAKYGSTLFDDPPLQRFFFSGDIFGRSHYGRNTFPSIL